jgi:hypothetical protein
MQHPIAKILDGRVEIFVESETDDDNKQANLICLKADDRVLWLTIDEMRWVVEAGGPLALDFTGYQ